MIGITFLWHCVCDMWGAVPLDEEFKHFKSPRARSAARSFQFKRDMFPFEKKDIVYIIVNPAFEQEMDNYNDNNDEDYYEAGSDYQEDAEDANEEEIELCSFY